MNKINSLNDTISKVTKEINITTIELEDTVGEIEFVENAKEGKLAEKEAKFIEQKSTEIENESIALAEPINKKIIELRNKLETNDIDESEDLKAERKAMEYLNTASKDIGDYLGELQKSVTPSFIDNGFVSIGYTANQFRKAYKTIPTRVNNLRIIRNKTLPPYSLFKDKQVEKSGSVTFYKVVAYSWFKILINIPALLKFSIKRARYIHNCCQVYHRLMMSMTELKFATATEIIRLFNELIQLRNEKLIEEIDKLEQQLLDLEVQRDEQINAIVYDKESEAEKINNYVIGLKATKMSLKSKLEELTEKKEQLLEQLKEAEEEYEVRLLAEREYYLEDKEEREVVIPKELLFGYSKIGNDLFELKPGLYMYDDLDTVNDFIRLIVFQLRNIMEWGSIQFRVFDLFGGDSVSRLALSPDDKANTQDIFIYSLSSERDEAITLMHDLLIRRKPQISPVANNLGDFNLIQKENNSPPQSYQLLFFIYTDVVKPTEKLIQLIYTGYRIGIYPFIFHKQTLTDLSLVKVLGDYISNFVELTDTGTTAYSAKDFLAIKEEEEADKKKNI